MLAYVQDYISARYASRENELGLEQMRALEKLVLLRTIDELWIDHISAMEHLRDTVRLRAYGQRDPLAEYKIEAQRVFGRLMESIKAQVVNVIFKVSMVQKPKEVKAVEGRANVEGQNIVERESQRAAAVHRLESEKIGRNDPCPCGAINPATGEVYKWKKCGMINAPHHKK